VEGKLLVDVEVEVLKQSLLPLPLLYLYEGVVLVLGGEATHCKRLELPEPRLYVLLRLGLVHLVVGQPLFLRAGLILYRRGVQPPGPLPAPTLLVLHLPHYFVVAVGRF
jgi:hypothetical protein